MNRPSRAATHCICIAKQTDVKHSLCVASSKEVHACILRACLLFCITTSSATSVCDGYSCSIRKLGKETTAVQPCCGNCDAHVLCRHRLPTARSQVTVRMQMSPQQHAALKRQQKTLLATGTMLPGLGQMPSATVYNRAGSTMSMVSTEPCAQSLCIEFSLYNMLHWLFSPCICFYHTWSTRTSALKASARRDILVCCVMACPIILHVSVQQSIQHDVKCLWTCCVTMYSGQVVGSLDSHKSTSSMKVATSAPPMETFPLVSPPETDARLEPAPTAPPSEYPAKKLVSTADTQALHE